MVYEFEGIIEAAPRGGAWIRFPFDTQEAFGTRRSVRVVATYDGHEARSNVVSMGGGPVLGVHKATRAAIGKGVGETVSITLRVDDSPRTVSVPPELQAAFQATPSAKSAFQALSFTHRREFAEWVGSAKRLQTRERRAAKAIDMMGNGTTL